MFSISISNSEKEIFTKNIVLFKSECKNYQSNNDNFNEDLLCQLFDNVTDYLDLKRKSKFYKILVSEDWLASVINLLKLSFEKNEWSLFNKLIHGMIKITSSSEFLCESLIKDGVSEILINVYLRALDENIFSSSNNEFFVNVINLIYNIARHIHLQQYFLQYSQACRFKKAILPVISDVDDRVSINATFTLIWLTKDDDQDRNLFKGRNDIIANIVRCIKSSLVSKERSFGGLSTLELLQGLQGLSAIETLNSEIVLVEEYMSVLVEIITSKLSPENDIALSVRILWNLSFLESNRNLLKTKYNIAEVVKPLSKSDSKVIRKSVKGLLWDLNNNEGKEGNSKNLKYDIFLSYSHEQKDLVLKIAKQLKKTYSIWIDKDNIKGSSLDDMASGIERSRIFVMCISNSYKQSQYCHSEANYAYQKKKPIIPLLLEHKYKPDGWLGIIISSELYIDVSEFVTDRECMDKVIDGINHKLRKNKGIAYKTMSLRDLTRQHKTFKEWNENDVTRWLSTDQLTTMQSKFTGFDGEMIDAMVKMKTEVPEIYYKLLITDMDLKMPEILKFNSALSKLS